VDIGRISGYIAMIERDYNYFVSKKAKEYNFKKHDIRVLKVINANDGISQNEICTIIKEDKITVSKAVKNLVSEGYVQRVKDLEDGRVTRLFMTEEGLFYRQKILKIFEEVNQIFLRNFSDEERAVITMLLKKMSDNIHVEACKLKEE